MDRPRRPPPPSARKTALGLSQQEQQLLAVEALGLLSEQIESRIVHYRADLETNAELDAITAQVVTQLKAMQAKVGVATARRRTPETIEREQIDAFAGLLQKLLGPGHLGEFVTQMIRPLGRRVARLFFESEIHQPKASEKDRSIRFAEQGMFYLLSRYHHRMRAELEGFEYATPEVKAQTLELVDKIERDYKTAFLSRRSRELHRVMTVLTAVLSEFLERVLLASAEALATRVIRVARTSSHETSVGYRIGADAFPDFRRACEKELVEQVVTHVSRDLLARLADAKEAYLEETIAFFTTPQIYSTIVEVMCDTLYDALHQQGFLDLPLDWRLQKSSADPG